MQIIHNDSIQKICVKGKDTLWQSHSQLGMDSIENLDKIFLEVRKTVKEMPKTIKSTEGDISIEKNDGTKNGTYTGIFNTNMFL